LGPASADEVIEKEKDAGLNVARNNKACDDHRGTLTASISKLREPKPIDEINHNRAKKDETRRSGSG